MKLTVDASVAVKWFVTEDLCNEARSVLARRIERYAPEFLLFECANTIWKKARRGEIPDPRPYRQELASLSDVLAFSPDRALLERGTEITFDLDHPVYDCLYVACAEATNSDLITADSRLARKVTARYPEPRVHYVGAPGVAEWIDAVGTAPVIAEQKLEDLARAYEVCARTEQSVVESLLGGPAEIPVTTVDENLMRPLDTPAWRRLGNLLGRLNGEEMIDLLACGWLGADLLPSWRRSFEHAERMVASLDPTYAAGYGRHWRIGYARAMDGLRAIRLREGT